MSVDGVQIKNKIVKIDKRRIFQYFWNKLIIADKSRVTKLNREKMKLSQSFSQWRSYETVEIGIV